MGEIKKFFANKLYKTVIPRGVRLSEAPSYGCPIQYYDKRSKGCIAYNDLAKEFMVDFDDAGSIGKRYRREDEIGTNSFMNAPKVRFQSIP